MKLIILSTVAGLAAVAGCQAPPVVAPPPALPVERLGGLSPSIVVESSVLRRDSGVPMFVAGLRNTSQAFSFTLEWQVEFKDDFGTQVAASDTRWAQVALRPGESKQLQLVASSPAARDFVLKIRPK
jgi:uncharacterized protein YcfL